MTKEDAVKQLKELQGIGDTESSHIMADEVLCQLLTSLGFEDVVSEYNKIDMWYA